MACPFCGAEAVRKDYAPPRPFAYLLGGGALLFATMFVPDAVAVWSETRRNMIQLLGFAALLVGSVELQRHGNRYCGVCGMKFRAARRNAPGLDRRRLLEGDGASAPASTSPADEIARPFAVWRKAAGHSHRAGDDPPADTPIPPLLKCLRFKDPSMRAEAAETLRKVTGQDFGEDADAWDRWWEERKNRDS